MLSEPLASGVFRRHADFPSRHLKSARTVLVYVPPQYAERKDTRFPVLYLHDGQNLFDGATSFVPGQEWRADETADRLIRERRIEPVILVGVYNAGAERLNEYTPTRDRRGRGGGGDAYLRFLTDELKPFVDRHYRTRPEASETGVGGSSLGALISLHAGLRRPDVFGKVAALSPSVWWDEKWIVEQVRRVGARPALRVWLDIGTDEGYAALPDARLLRDAMAERGWREGQDLAYIEAEGAGHNEAAWAARFDRVLQFLYPKR